MKNLTPYSLLCVILLYVQGIKVEELFIDVIKSKKYTIPVHCGVGFTILQHFFVVGMVFTTIEF